MKYISSIVAFLQRFQKILSPLLVVVTIGLFAYIFATEQSMRETLLSVNSLVFLSLLGLYGLFIVCLSWVYAATLQLCGASIKQKENFLLTCYSTIANFFGPLQSGPGVRAVYLKSKHGVKLKSYTLASLIYYALYAMISALFILVGSGTNWPIALFIFGLVAVVCTVVLLFGRKFAARNKLQLELDYRRIIVLAIATLCQLLIMIIIFYVELRAVGAGPSLAQAAVYTGAANFALFLAITPGALGVREAFLAFSIGLHTISSTHIIAMSTLDRTVFIVFLGILFLLTVSTHATDKIKRAVQTKS